jgi:predicted transcriptional regulator
MSKAEDFRALIAATRPQEAQEALGVAKVLPEQENASKVPQNDSGDPLAPLAVESIPSAAEGNVERAPLAVESTADNIPSAAESPDKSALEEALATTESTLAPTAAERQILGYILEGVSVESISLKVGVTPAAIRGFLRKPKVKEYIKELREAAAEIDHMMLTSLTRGIIQQRVEESEGDLSNLTRKDTLDVIKLFSEITSQTLKGAKDEKEQDVFVNIYNQILS